MLSRVRALATLACGLRPLLLRGDRRRAASKQLARPRGGRTRRRGCASRRPAASASRYSRDAGQHDRAPLLGGEPAVAAGDLEARRQPLDVPLPRARQGLVEVVDVEHQLPLGRGEHPEVRQVRVTAELDGQARAGRGGQVGGHDQRGAAVERERRDQHPAVADRHQLGDPLVRLLLEQRDRVGAVAAGSHRRGCAGEPRCAPPCLWPHAPRGSGEQPFSSRYSVPGLRPASRLALVRHSSLDAPRVVTLREEAH